MRLVLSCNIKKAPSFQFGPILERSQVRQVSCIKIVSISTYPSFPALYKYFEFGVPLILLWELFTYVNDCCKQKTAQFWQEIIHIIICGPVFIEFQEDRIQIVFMIEWRFKLCLVLIFFNYGRELFICRDILVGLIVDDSWTWNQKSWVFLKMKSLLGKDFQIFMRK